MRRVPPAKDAPGGATLFWPPIRKEIVLAFVAMMVVPFSNTIATSVSSARDVIEGGFTLFPRNPTLDSYRALLRSMCASIGITLVDTTVQVAFTTMMAYGLSKPDVPGARFALRAD